jgi:hypothetical protein
MTEKDERLSKLQLKILDIMYKIIESGEDLVNFVENNEITGWVKSWAVYYNLRKRLRIHKLTFLEIVKKSGIDPNIIPLKLMTMGIIERDNFENQWDDDCLKVSFSRSIHNMRRKGLIKIGNVKNSKEQVLAFTEKGFTLYKKKMKMKV